MVNPNGLGQQASELNAIAEFFVILFCRFSLIFARSHFVPPSW